MRPTPVAAVLAVITSVASCAIVDRDEPDAAPTGSAGAAGNAGAAGSAGSGGQTPEYPSLLRRAGRQIVTERGAPVWLTGVSFGNTVWSAPTTAPTFHHDERDFARLESWGMNAVRFYLNYQLFESDREPYVYRDEGWAWLDRNIAWAKRHGVYLILNMHVPQGGYQSIGGGDALWENPDNQARLTALWRAIAERYRDEPTIAGYDLLNEPRAPESKQQWVDLAVRMTQAIREVDTEHLIVVERLNSVGDDWSNDADMNLFLVPDDNILYQFHFYSPIEYTHQHASWTDFGEGGRYPDETRISNSGLTWYEWSWKPAPPPYLTAGDSDWTYYESQPYSIDDPAIKALGIALVSELNAGTAYFDDLVLKEYDASGAFVRNVYEQDLETLDGWYFWKAGTGTAEVSREAHSGRRSLAISGTDHDANLGLVSIRFAPRPGYRYAVGGYMKGVGVSDETRPDPRGDWTQHSRALIRLDYLTAEGEPLRRNQAALAAEIDRYQAWATTHDVPLYLGEFGCIEACFEQDRGGLTWVTDVLDLLAERGIHFTYHAYHEGAFGIFQSDPARQLPDDTRANAPLIELFRSQLSP